MIGSSGREGFLNRLDRIRELHRRLDRVIIENLDYAELIRRYDHPDNFFYLDPPYFTKERLYERDDAEAFTRHEDLAAILKGIKGKFLLSYNDDSNIRELYKGFQIKQVTRAKGINRKEGKMDYAEVIIANFPLEEQC